MRAVHAANCVNYACHIVLRGACVTPSRASLFCLHTARTFAGIVSSVLGVDERHSSRVQGVSIFQYRGGADFLEDRSLRRCQALQYTKIVMNRYAMCVWNAKQSVSHIMTKSAGTLTHQCLLSRSPSSQKKKIDRGRQQSGRRHDDQCTGDALSSLTCYKNVVGQVCRLSGAWQAGERRIRFLHRRLIPTHPLHGAQQKGFRNRIHCMRSKTEPLKTPKVTRTEVQQAVYGWLLLTRDAPAALKRCPLSCHHHHDSMLALLLANRSQLPLRRLTARGNIMAATTTIPCSQYTKDRRAVPVPGSGVAASLTEAARKPGRVNYKCECIIGHN